MTDASQHISRTPYGSFLKHSCLLFFALAAACTISSCTLFRAGDDGLSAEDRAFYSAYSKKLGIRFTGTENKELIKTVSQWLGAPYQLGGCSRAGVDCSCFVQMVYAQVYGIALKRSSREMIGNVRLIGAKDLREGDLLFLKKGDRVSHVGIYIKEGKFAHVSTARGVVISSLQEQYYRKYFYAGGRAFDARPKITTR